MDCNSNPVPLLNKMRLANHSTVTLPWTPLTLNLVFTAIYLAIFLPLNLVGYKLIKSPGFFCKDPTISYKHNGDSLRLKPALLANCVMPILYIIVLEPLKNIRFSKKRILNLFCLYWDYLVGGCIGWGLCTIAKILVQSPRPDFLDYCAPDTAVNCTAGAYVPTVNYCLNMVNEKDKEFMTWMSVSSFPSGHSLLSMYCAIFCSYLIEKRFPTEVGGMAFKGMLHIVSFYWGIHGILSRYADRRHHWWDITTGVVAGVANVMYIIYVINKRYHLDHAEVSLKKSRSSMEAVCDCQCPNQS